MKSFGQPSGMAEIARMRFFMFMCLTLSLSPNCRVRTEAYILCVHIIAFVSAIRCVGPRYCAVHVGINTGRYARCEV